MKASPLSPWLCPRCLGLELPLGHPGPSRQMVPVLGDTEAQSQMEPTQLGSISPSFLEKVLLRPPSC